MTRTAQKLPAHHAAAFASFMNEFLGESDRAAVILGASKVENLLGEILDKFLIALPSGTDDLLDGDSPIGTFSARIKLCHRLGLIDNQLAKSLNVFRKLRNEFAHEVTSSSLAVGSARDRVAALAEPYAGTDFFQDLLSKVSGQMKREASDTGAIFRAVLALFHVHLTGIHNYLVPVQRQQLLTVKEFCQTNQSANS